MQSQLDGAPGQRSRHEVFIAVGSDSLSASPPAIDDSSDNAGRGGDTPLRILIVDDNRDTIMTLGILLRSEGYLVSLANNGGEALAVAAVRPPDVALIDLHMPGRSGFEVAREFRERFAAKVPILIAVTAHTGEKYRRHAQESGFQHFVAKPYDPQELLKLLDSLAPKSAL